MRHISNLYLHGRDTADRYVHRIEKNITQHKIAL